MLFTILMLLTYKYKSLTCYACLHVTFVIRARKSNEFIIFFFMKQKSSIKYYQKSSQLDHHCTNKIH